MEVSDKITVLSELEIEMHRAGYGGWIKILREKFGGTRIYIPSKPSGSNLEKILGKKVVHFLSEKYGGNIFSIPSGKGNRGLKKLIIESKDGTRETARKLGCDEAYVRRVRAMVRKTTSSQKDAI